MTNDYRPNVFLQILMNAPLTLTAVTQMQLAEIPTVAIPALVTVATREMGSPVQVTMSLFIFPFC